MYADLARDTSYVPESPKCGPIRHLPTTKGFVHKITTTLALEPWLWLNLLCFIAFAIGFLIIVCFPPSLFTPRAQRTAPRDEPKLESEEEPPPSPSRPSSAGLKAGLEHGLCGSNEIHLSRVPHKFKKPPNWSVYRYNRPKWLALLGVVHSRPVSLSVDNEDYATIELTSPWPEDLMRFVRSQSQTIGEPKSCISISRATLMTLFALTNARPVFSYSSATGHRSAYPSYCGQWSITWPIGRPCFVSLAPHDSHTAATDVYPPSFPVRVDKCVEMLAGVVTNGRGWKLGFPGRAKSKGPWVLRKKEKGLAGAHGQRHLWNMLGGKVWEVDTLILEPAEHDEADEEFRLEVPTVSGHSAVVIPTGLGWTLLAEALDCLPWSSLSWSMHRGMRDILLAYGKPTMNRYRVLLASVVKEGVNSVEADLVQRGWNADFVKDAMGDLAESAVLSGSGNSGDMVRVVVAIAECLIERPTKHPVDQDKTSFWSYMEIQKAADLKIESQALIALIKFFVLEWSQELDYQLYHELPVELYLA